MAPQQTDSDEEDFKIPFFGRRTGTAPSRRPDEKLGTSNFLDLLGKKNESSYIDKTELVEAFFKCKRSRVLVTAPRRFGKTINIAMLETFFQLQIPAHESKRLSEIDIRTRVKSTDNYKLFYEHNLIITRNLGLMKEHFGKYPVINISFHCEIGIKSYDEAIAFCLSVIGSTFRKHRYLQSSAALTSDEKKVCTKWYNQEWDMKHPVDELEILSGLQKLAQYMCKHYGKRIVLLVDDYDSVVTQAVLNVECMKEVKRIVTNCTSIIKTAVKENANENWVEYAFITGTSHISGMDSCSSNVEPYRFLGDHLFVPYYGLVVDELSDLLEITYGFNKQEIDHAKTKLSGYTSKTGKRIYNLWSVLQWICDENKDYDWQDTGMITGLAEAFRFPIIKAMIETQLLLDVPINTAELKKTMNVDDIVHLVRLIRNVDTQNVRFPRPDLFFTFLFEQGYLSYIPTSPGLVMLPNEQVKQEITRKLTEFNTEVFGIDQRLNNNCKQFITKLSSVKCDYDYFKNFQVNLDAFVQQYAATWVNINEENLRCSINILLVNSGLKVYNELTVTYKDFGGKECIRKLEDYILIKDNFAMVVECKYKETNKAAIFCIRDRDYCKAFEADNIFRYLVQHYVLLGINMDENGHISIGYLQDSKNFDEVVLIP